jgi:hypothetical protein
VAIPSTGTSRPGVRVGSTSEFSLFFRVRPGHEHDLRQAVEALQSSPGYRPGDYDLPMATIHEARFVLFDDDTRLLFATSFDGPWDAYMEDFAAKPLKLFDSIFRHGQGDPKGAARERGVPAGARRSPGPGGTAAPGA